MEATVAGQILALEKVAWAFAEEVRKRDPTSRQRNCLPTQTIRDSSAPRFRQRSRPHQGIGGKISGFA